MARSLLDLAPLECRKIIFGTEVQGKKFCIKGSDFGFPVRHTHPLLTNSIHPTIKNNYTIEVLIITGVDYYWINCPMVG